MVILCSDNFVFWKKWLIISSVICLAFAISICKYKKIETVGERKKYDDELNNALDGIDIKDILTLLEMSIQDLGHQMEVLVKLKVLNKRYYENASKPLYHSIWT